MGLEAAHPGQRLVQHPLEVGQLHHPPGGVAHRGEIAHLGHREEALVLGVVAGHAQVEEDVLHRGQALQVELGEPPELHAAEEHGVDAAVAPVLGEIAGATTEGEVLLAGLAPEAVPGHRHRHRRPPHRAGEAGGGQRRPHPLDSLLDRSRRERAPQVQLERQLHLRRCLGGEAGQDPGGPGHLAHRRETGVEPDAAALARVLGHRTAHCVLHPDGDRPHRRDAVVAAQERLHQPGAQPGGSTGHPLDEQGGQRLGAGHQPGDDRLALGVLHRRQGGQILLRLDVGRRPGRLEERLIESLVAQLAGQVGQRGVQLPPELGEPVEQPADLRPALVQGRRLGGQATFQDAEDGHHGVRDPLVRLLDAKKCGLQLQPGGLQGHAVVGKSPSQPLHEFRGEAHTALLRLVQVAPKLLERRLAVAVPAHGPAEERLDVDEGGEGGLLGGQDLGVVAHHAGRKLGPPGRQPPALSRGDVEAEQNPPQLVQRRQVALAGGERRRGRRRHQGERPRRLGGGLRIVGLQPDERRTRIHLGVGHRHHLADHPGRWRGHHDLHLHRLHPGHRVAGRDPLPDVDRNGHHHRRQGGHHQAGRLTLDDMGDAVHLDQVAQPVHAGEHPGPPIAEHEPSLAIGEPLDPYLQRRPTGGHHLIAGRPDLADLQPVALSVEPQLGDAARGGAHPGSAPASLGQEALPLEGQVQVVDLECRRDQRHLRPGGNQLIARPGQVGHPLRAGEHLRVGAEGRHPGLGRAAPAHQHIGVLERLRQAGESLRPVVAQGHHRSHRLAGAAQIALVHLRLGPQGGVGRQAQPLDSPPAPARITTHLARDDAGSHSVPGARRRDGAHRLARRQGKRQAGEVHARGGFDGRCRARERFQPSQGLPARVVDGQPHRRHPHPARGPAGTCTKLGRFALPIAPPLSADALRHQHDLAELQGDLSEPHHPRPASRIARHHRLQLASTGERCRVGQYRADLTGQGDEPLAGRPPNHLGPGPD